MTESLQDLDRHLEAASELHTVTRTMRGLAAVNLRHYERAVQAIDKFEAVVEDGLHVALRDGRIDQLPIDAPPSDAPTAMIVFGSNHGLCGPINRHVAAHAAAEAATVTSLTQVAVVGARVGAELELAGHTPDTRWDLPATIETIPPRAEQLLTQADKWRRRHDTARLLLVFPHFLGRHRGYEPVTLQLLPTDRDWLEWLAIRRWPSRVLPTFTMPWNVLVADLIRQALLVRLHRSFAQTMAAVSASRLVAMDAAQRNIEERVSNLEKQHHQLRHTEITKELLDVVSGFELLEQQEHGHSTANTQNRVIP